MPQMEIVCVTPAGCHEDCLEVGKDGVLTYHPSDGVVRAECTACGTVLQAVKGAAPGDATWHRLLGALVVHVMEGAHR